MTKIFALLAVLLIASGVIVLAVPKPAAPPAATERGMAPQSMPIPTLADQAREIAEKINAPLSIVFGLVSLYYSRRTYLINREAIARRPGAEA